MGKVGPDNSDWIGRLAEEARILGEARMLRDEDDVTPEITTAIASRFRDLLKRIEKSETWAARSLGIQASVLSQVLSNSYGADPEKHVRAIDKWIEQQIMRENAPRPSGFVRTSVAEKIYAVTKWIQEINGIGVAHGPAGVGKTITAQAIRAETPGSLYIRITTAGQTKIAVLKAIATNPGLRLTGLQLSADQLQQQVITALKDTRRLIIVDEVHKLVEKRKDEGLHALRDTHDETGCPMMFFGMSNFADYVQQGKNRYEPLDQLNSRIKWWLDLREIANPQDGGPGLYSIDDIRKMLAASKIRITSDGERYLQMLANEPGQGALRTVATLIQIAQRFAADKTINATLLRDIRRQQMGARAAEQIEQMMNLRSASAG